MYNDLGIYTIHTRARMHFVRVSGITCAAINSYPMCEVNPGSLLVTLE